MAGSCHGRLRRFSAIAVAAIAVSALMQPAPAHAQNLLQSLFEALGGRSAYAPEPVHARAPDTGAWDFLDRGSNPQEKEFGAQAEFSGPQTAYCVRLCDGRYFPLPRRAGPANMNDAKICSAMCPAAQTAVFNGRVIDHAIAPDGKKYSSLKNAFLYREKNVDNCTCKPGGASGVAKMEPLHDPTLRRGDIVVTRDGPMVFTGGRSGKDAAQSFVRAEDYKGLSAGLRQQLSEMRIAGQPSEMATLPAGARPALNAGTASLNESPARQAAAASSPVAEAFASFAR